MARPIIVDDGGSVRIKLALQDSTLNGDMESLLDVNNNGHSDHGLASGYGIYSEVIIYWIDAVGELKRTNPPVLPCNKVTVTTDTGVQVEFKTGPANKISLDGRPFLDSKKHGNQRSYTILNGGRINKIEVQPGNMRVEDLNRDFVHFAAVIR